MILIIVGNKNNHMFSNSYKVKKATKSLKYQSIYKLNKTTV